MINELPSNSVFETRLWYAAIIWDAMAHQWELRYSQTIDVHTRDTQQHLSDWYC